jgi:hypothetical protein
VKTTAETCEHQRSRTPVLLCCPCSSIAWASCCELSATRCGFGWGGIDVRSGLSCADEPHARTWPSTRWRLDRREAIGGRSSLVDSALESRTRVAWVTGWEARVCARQSTCGAALARSKVACNPWAALRPWAHRTRCIRGSWCYALASCF